MKSCKQFLKSNDGVFALMSAITVPIFLGLVGAALTTGNVTTKRSYLQGAADLAVLSGSSTYKNMILTGESEAKARTQALSSADKFFQFNTANIINNNNRTATAYYDASGALRIDVTDGDDVIFKDFVGQQSHVNFDVVSVANTAVKTPNIDFKSIELLNAADKGQSIEPFLNGLQITAYEEVNYRNPDNLKVIDRQVLTDENILKNFDATCKAKRNIGYNTTNDKNQCSFFSSLKNIVKSREVLDLSLTNNKNSFETLDITLSDVHVHSEGSKYPVRVETIEFEVFGNNDKKIGTFTADAKGNIQQFSKDLKITAQPLTDAYKPVAFNLEGSSAGSIGLFQLSIHSITGRPVKRVRVVSENSSFQLVAINAATQRSRPIVLTR